MGTEKRGSWGKNRVPTGLGMLPFTPHLPATAGATQQQTGVGQICSVTSGGERPSPFLTLPGWSRVSGL